MWNGLAAAGRHYQTSRARSRLVMAWIHAPLPERRNSLDPLAGQSETGAREPSEDTVKRATFARM
jgi:hypothetical protein